MRRCINATLASFDLDCSHMYFRVNTVDSRYLEFQGLSEILRDIRTSTYQICRVEEKLIRLTTFNKYMRNWTKIEIY